MAERRGSRDKRKKSTSRSAASKGRSKVCRFCSDKARAVDYKDVNRLRGFMTERGRIIPRRVSGNCARHQRQLSIAVKRAREAALLPYCTT